MGNSIPYRTGHLQGMLFRFIRGEVFRELGSEGLQRTTSMFMNLQKSSRSFT